MADTIMAQVGTKVGTVARSLRDTLSALETRATALEAKAANWQPKPNAEFFRYAPRISLGATLKAKGGEVALSAHVRCAGKDYYFHIEAFMGYILQKMAPTVMVSPTQKLVIGDLGRVMAYGQFIDPSGKYTEVYSLGQVFLDMVAAAADNLPAANDQTVFATSMTSPPRAEHPVLRSEGGTTVTVASASASDLTPLYAALRGNPTATTTGMTRTTTGKWGADLMKCWVEHCGVLPGDTARPLYQAWVAFMAKVCQAADPSFTLVFSNRAGTGITAPAGDPSHY